MNADENRAISPAQMLDAEYCGPVNLSHRSGSLAARQGPIHLGDPV